ncbi:MAG: thioredoxin family protein [Ignavibacteriaceae bacterium]|nr:MAG: thioredoxin family protein [Chlorobiota bacterium]MBV6399274.1 hypothetical protein [Ignavibacteria bacterium]MCC6884947.1 thioredoxin family protein [Ignavibacteriales bacterium]MCE7953522.1 thioredoxin family protein [Chlorobi bacterium CHB7]MDL1887588.1 thioredoxin family protein [Ignavibacteria bacterium CHB1]MEB2329284.1 thioredoxin family protein [Ignavibacteriaceae bacterium]RIK49288.1 MAG: thioredoxin family protein [Ignavibacteriota bacterium]
MALKYSNELNPGSEIIHFELKGTDGDLHSPEKYADKEIIVIIFMCNHCPYVKAITGRLVKLHSDYKDKGVQLIGINPNDPVQYPEDSFDEMIKFSIERGLKFPYLTDHTQEVAHNYYAACTPDIYVFDRERKLRYHGRLDDNWQDEDKVTSSDLQKAIDLLLEKRAIDFQQIPSMGCSIKWKN